MQKVFNTKKSLFIPFIMAGHPTLEDSVQAIIALSQAGADIIELGVPFSDPVADGPVNQRAAEIALKNGMSLESTIELVRTVRSLGVNTPIIIFSYLNPILAMGTEQFAIKAKSSGANGVLIVDLPPEEDNNFFAILQSKNLEIVLLVSPTTDYSRLNLYQQKNPLFLYYISRLGVTGIQNEIAHNLNKEILKLRARMNTSKIAVGFGISTPEQASKIAQFADAVIIGSRLVKSLEEEGLNKFTHLVTQFAEAIHQVS